MSPLQASITPASSITPTRFGPDLHVPTNPNDTKEHACSAPLVRACFLPATCKEGSGSKRKDGGHMCGLLWILRITRDHAQGPRACMSSIITNDHLVFAAVRIVRV